MSSFRPFFMGLGRWPGEMKTRESRPVRNGEEARGGGRHELSALQEHHNLGGFDVGFPRARPAHTPLPNLRAAVFDA